MARSTIEDEIKYARNEIGACGINDFETRGYYEGYIEGLKVSQEIAKEDYDKKHLAAMTDMEKIEVATRKAVATVELVKLNALLEVYEEWMSPERFTTLAQIEALEKYLRG